MFKCENRVTLKLSSFEPAALSHLRRHAGRVPYTPAEASDN